MSEVSRKVQWIVWGGLAAVIVFICGAFVLSKLPGQSVANVTPPPPAPPKSELPVFSKIPEFTLTNQLGAEITRESFAGSIWVADIIFTRCPSICPVMSGQMQELQSTLSENSAVKLVSITTDPEYDTPEILNKYAETFEAEPNRWHMLTGELEQTVALIRHGLKLTAMEKAPEERAVEADLFNHSTMFAIVDQKGQLRAVVRTEDPDWKSKLLTVIDALETSPAK